MFLLINTRNSFKEEIQTVMLWAVQHEWPSGAQIDFKHHHHWFTFVISEGRWIGHFYTVRRVTGK